MLFLIVYRVELIFRQFPLATDAILEIDGSYKFELLERSLKENVPACFTDALSDSETTVRTAPTNPGFFSTFRSSSSARLENVSHEFQPVVDEGRDFVLANVLIRRESLFETLYQWMQRCFHLHTVPPAGSSKPITLSRYFRPTSSCSLQRPEADDSRLEIKDCEARSLETATWWLRSQNFRRGGAQAKLSREVQAAQRSYVIEFIHILCVEDVIYIQLHGYWSRQE